MAATMQPSSEGNVTSSVRVRSVDLRSKLLPLIGLTLLLCWPALTGSVGFLSPSATYVDLGTSTLVVVILVYSLNLAMGYSGLLSLMHSGFLGLGGYIAGYFASRQGWSIWACIAVALLAGAVVGALSAAVSLRATYLYFGIITLSFNSVIDEVAKEWRSVTLGEDGLSGIPNRIDVVDGIGNPLSFEKWFQTTPRYFIVLAATLAVFFFHRNVIRSRTGRSFQAVRESADTAMALGIRVATSKMLAFAMSGAIGALAGVFFAYHRQFINPAVIAQSPLVLFSGLLIGGNGTLFGPFVGVVLYTAIEEVLKKQSLIEEHPLYSPLILGVLLWIILIAMPKGIVGSFQASRVGSRLRPRDLGGSPSRNSAALAANDSSRPGNSARSAPEVLAWASPSTGTHADVAAGSPILVARDVAKSFGGIKALQGVDVTVLGQEVHGIIGPNGSGKSTFVNCATAFLHRDSGTVEMFGKPSPQRPDLVASAGVVRVFQVPHLFERVSALENVLTGMHMRSKQNWLTGSLRLPSFFRDEKDMRAEGRALLELAGLGDKINELAANLSHGQKRLLEVARAVAAHPKILMLDEPATGLTADEVASLAELIKTLQAGGLSIVLIEHNVNFVMKVCDRITVFEQGKVIAVGTPVEIQSNVDVQRAYLGAGDVADMVGV